MKNFFFEEKICHNQVRLIHQYKKLWSLLFCLVYLVKYCTSRLYLNLYTILVVEHSIYQQTKLLDPVHTIYTRNNMGQKCEGNCGLWVLNEIVKKTYPENLKKIVGAVWKLPARQHSQSSPFPLKLGRIGCAIQQVTSKRHP